MNEFLAEPKVDNSRRVTYENIRYGMLVEVLHDDGYHAGCKVHFFNKKGVLVGNYYKFVPYDGIRLREPNTKEQARRYQTTISRNYPRYFYGQRFEKIKNWILIMVCNIVTRLLRFTERMID